MRALSLVAAARQVGGIELTLENRVLHMVAEFAHGLVRFGEAAIVAGVVAGPERIERIAHAYSAGAFGFFSGTVVAAGA